MQNRVAERAFYADLFGANPENEHITSGYEELHQLAMPVIPSGLVLDLGCGTGAHTVRLARRGCRVVAVDLTREGVRAARERCRREGLPGHFFVGDAERLPLREGAVDVAWTFLLLHHFPRLDALPAELTRVTRTRVIAFEPNAWNLLTWLANNVVNRFWGIAAMTPNQRALRAGSLQRAFARRGFSLAAVHYIDRAWADRVGWVRRLYQAVASPLGMKFRANKFLATFVRNAA